MHCTWWWWWLMVLTAQIRLQKSNNKGKTKQNENKTIPHIFSACNEKEETSMWHCPLCYEYRMEWNDTFNHICFYFFSCIYVSRNLFLFGFVSMWKWYKLKVMWFALSSQCFHARHIIHIFISCILCLCLVFFWVRWPKNPDGKAQISMRFCWFSCTRTFGQNWHLLCEWFEHVF